MSQKILTKKREVINDYTCFCLLPKSKKWHIPYFELYGDALLLMHLKHLHEFEISQIQCIFYNLFSWVKLRHCECHQNFQIIYVIFHHQNLLVNPQHKYYHMGLHVFLKNEINRDSNVAFAIKLKCVFESNFKISNISLSVSHSSILTWNFSFVQLKFTLLKCVEVWARLTSKTL